MPQENEIRTINLMENRFTTGSAFESYVVGSPTRLYTIDRCEYDNTLKLLKNKLDDKYCFYFLVGDQTLSQIPIYVGKSKDYIKHRATDHLEKDYWTKLIIVTDYTLHESPALNIENTFRESLKVNPHFDIKSISQKTKLHLNDTNLKKLILNTFKVLLGNLEPVLCNKLFLYDNIGSCIDGISPDDPEAMMHSGRFIPDIMTRYPDWLIFKDSVARKIKELDKEIIVKNMIYCVFNPLKEKNQWALIAGSKVHKQLTEFVQDEILISRLKVTRSDRYLQDCSDNSYLRVVREDIPDLNITAINNIGHGDQAHGHDLYELHSNLSYHHMSKHDMFEDAIKKLKEQNTWIML